MTWLLTQRLLRCTATATLAMAVAGGIGLPRGTVDAAQAEVRSVQVPLAAGSLLYAGGRGLGGFAGWTESDGTPLRGWSLAGDMLVSTGTDAGKGTIIPPYQPGKHMIADYAVEAQIQLQQTLPGASGYPNYGLQARGQGGYGYFAVYEADGHAGYPEIWNIHGYTRIAAKFFLQFNPHIWHTYREEVVGKDVRFLIDGVMVLHGQNTQWTDGGFAGLYAYYARIAVRSFTIRALSHPSLLRSPTCGACLSAAMLDWWSGDQVARWTVQGGRLVSDPKQASAIGPDASPGDSHLSNYAVQTRIQVLKVMLCNCNYPPYFVLRLRGYSNVGYDATVAFESKSLVRVELWYGAGNQRLAVKDLAMSPIGTHTYREEVQGTSIRFLVDGSVVAQASNTTLKDGGYIQLNAYAMHMVVQSFKVSAL